MLLRTLCVKTDRTRTVGPDLRTQGARNSRRAMGARRGGLLYSKYSFFSLIHALPACLPASPIPSSLSLLFYPTVHRRSFEVPLSPAARPTAPPAAAAASVIASSHSQQPFPFPSPSSLRRPAGEVVAPHLHPSVRPSVRAPGSIAPPSHARSVRQGLS